VGIGLAVLCAFVYGCADFCGGKATRHVPTATVAFTSQMIGLAVVLVFAPIVPSDGLTWRAAIAGAAGGAAGVVGIMCLYHALAIGTMSVVSPVTAVVSALVPIGVGLAVGETLSPLAGLGVATGLAAIVLVSLATGSGGPSNRSAVWFALAAGAGFGLFFVALARSGDNPGLWPLVFARAISLIIAAVVARQSGAALIAPRAHWPIVAGAGALDMAANVLFLYAKQYEKLAIVSVISAMYPGSTVALARIVDRERLTNWQRMGLGIALMSVGAMAYASNA
jgi:drug/metabolite transporter (DMT)-like permease